jgi:hypothetical protein
MLHFNGLVYRGQQLRIEQQLVKKTHRENFGGANKRDNRFNRELGRRLKRQVLCGSRNSRNGRGLAKLVVEFRDAKTARILRRLGRGGALSRLWRSNRRREALSFAALEHTCHLLFSI